MQQAFLRLRGPLTTEQPFNNTRRHAKSASPAASERDRALAEQMSSYWVNFAKTGDPNRKDLPMWARFQDRQSAPYVLGEMAEVPGADVLNPLDEAYEKLPTNLKATGK